MYFIDTAGASPSQAKPEHILALDMVGTGYAVEAFGKVMAKGGAGLIISSQTGYMFPIPNDVELTILNTPTEELMNLAHRKNLFFMVRCLLVQHISKHHILYTSAYVILQVYIRQQQEFSLLKILT